jgi:threonine dehydratase
MFMERTTPIPISLAEVQSAAERIAGIAQHTPLLRSETLSEHYGTNIWLKLENLQTTGSFKLRGAYNKVATLNEEDRAHGLIAASSGNHAQGVAYAARQFGLDNHTRIYMPESTPKTKIANTRKHGEVQTVLVEGTLDNARATALEEAETTGAIFIEPYNDWAIIAGQGTTGLEIMQDLPETDIIISPVGGGGLLSGITLAAKSLNPSVRLFGVQCDYEYASGATIADGTRVKYPGSKPREIFAKYDVPMLHIPEADIAVDVYTLAETAKVVVEGSGAMGLTALRDGHVPVIPGGNIVIVLTGGNIDLARWQSIVNQS